MAPFPATTGSMGTPARAYSSLRLSDRARNGRRLEEDNEEQDQRLKPDLSGCRRPAYHRRKGAGGAANDPVLSVCRFSHTVSTTTWKKIARRTAGLSVGGRPVVSRLSQGRVKPPAAQAARALVARTGCRGARSDAARDSCAAALREEDEGRNKLNLGILRSSQHHFQKKLSTPPSRTVLMSWPHAPS